MRAAASRQRPVGEESRTLAYSATRSESGIKMQDASNLWDEFTGWLSLQMNLLQTHPAEAGRGFMSLLWNLSVWLNRGNKGLTIALILLVVIVNRILTRRR